MNKKTLYTSLLMAATLLLCIACRHQSVPTDYAVEPRQPRIMPDYTDVTIPPNLCPTNFIVTEPGQQVAVRFTLGNTSYTYGNGMQVCIDETEWARLMQEAKGKAITVETFVKNGKQWTAYQPFKINVATDDIDPYISYRIIPPSYVAYSHLALAQRNITNYDEQVFYDNKYFSDQHNGQCVNCHSYQNYHTGNMLFHLRHNTPGTIIVEDGNVKRVNLKTDSTISAGVYPSWHPTLPLIAFSTNLTGQTFHTKDIAKIEVQDTESDIILYDITHNSVYTIANDSDELEIYPTWAPDGNTLYYCSAHFEYQTDTTHEEELIARYQDIKYNIYARSFDTQTMQFGPRRLVFDASELGKSATLPRLSPDGRHLVFALGPWGCFHVWHPDADIYLMHLDNLEAEPLTAINSERSESYPSFSSNGRWIMTASRRDDGNYTRPYIAYFDNKGTCHKPFELPQRSPHHYITALYSYNRPEFMVEPVGFSAEQFATFARQDIINATYNGVPAKDRKGSEQKPDKKETTFKKLSETS